MSYVAIARKYRPRHFDEIAGQTHVVRALRHAIERGRIHHAWLFCGARGVGKTTAARALARALNCEHGPTPTPCGTCSACHEVDVGTSPDLIEIDGASNNSVDDIRKLRDTVHYPPQRRYKIYLIDEVHMLSRSAFNAMLKTLEEPPPQVVFIFATTEPGQIPDTILSRVLRFDFKRIGVDVVAGRLRAIAESEGVTISDTALRLLARAGEGSMRDAQSHLDKVIGITGDTISDEAVVEALGLVDRDLLLGMLRALLDGNAADALHAIARVHSYGLEMSQLCGELLDILHHAMLLRLGGGAADVLDLADAERQALQNAIGHEDPERLSRLFAVLLDTTDAVARSDRPRIVLEMAIAKLATVQPTVPVGSLVAKLEALESRLGAGQRAAPARTPPRAPSPAPPRSQAPQPRARSPRTPSPAVSSRDTPSADDDAPAATRSPASPPPQRASSAQEAALLAHPAISRFTRTFDVELESIQPIPPGSENPDER